MYCVASNKIQWCKLCCFRESLWCLLSTLFHPVHCSVFQLVLNSGFHKCRECEKVSRHTTRKRALKSHRLSETSIVWRNTFDTFTPRGLGYNRASCELVKCFELKEADGELHRSYLRRQPACLQPYARLITISKPGLCSKFASLQTLLIKVVNGIQFTKSVFVETTKNFGCNPNVWRGRPAAALEHGCGKEMMGASILFSRTNLLYFLNIEM